MQLLYTGADKYFAQQKTSKQSIGGYISSTEIPNGYDNSLFSNISLLAKQREEREIRLIAVLNNTANILNSLSVKFTIDVDSICTYKMAVVLPTFDSSNNQYFERLLNDKALPYTGQFNDIVNNNVINLLNLEPNKAVGLWIVRQIKPYVITSNQQFEQFIDDQINNPLPNKIKEEIKIEFSYT